MRYRVLCHFIVKKYPFSVNQKKKVYIGTKKQTEHFGAVAS